MIVMTAQITILVTIRTNTSKLVITILIAIIIIKNTVNT